MTPAIVVTLVGLPARMLADFRARHAGQQVFAVGDLPECEVVYMLKENELFSITRAANAGIRAAIKAGHDPVIKTDIDCVLPPVEAWAGAASGGRGAAFRYWEIKTATDTSAAKMCSRRCGTIVMTASDWQRAGYYNEDMDGYGFDDGDMIDRARKAGIRIDLLRSPRVFHVSHAPHNRNTINPLKRKENMRKA